MRQRLENPAKSGEEIIPHPIRASQSRDKAAAVCDVNERYVQDAKKLSLEAPSLLQKLKVGAIMLPAAMAALKRKNTDPEAWAVLLGGAMSLEGERPKCVCPICRGTGRLGGRINPNCVCCKGIGWIGVFNFDRLKPELRTLAENWRDAESVKAGGKKLDPAA